MSLYLIQIQIHTHVLHISMLRSFPIALFSGNRNNNVLVLQQAVRDKDQILATIATSTNQDGHAVTPISAPSVEQQKRLLEKVHGHSSPEELDKIDYIEAHGESYAV